MDYDIWMNAESGEVVPGVTVCVYGSERDGRQASGWGLGSMRA